MNQFQELKERKVLDKDGKVDAMGFMEDQNLQVRKLHNTLERIK